MAGSALAGVTPQIVQQKSLVTKLAEVMAAVERIAKRGRNDHFKYDFATEADIAAAIRKELSSRQVMLIPAVTGEARVVVGKTSSGAEKALTQIDMLFTFMDGESGEQIERPWKGVGIDSEDKGLYKAMTGGEKYFLLKTFLIPTGDDPERHEKDSRATVKPDKDTKKARVMPPAAQAEGAVFLEKVTPKTRGNQEWAELLLSTGEMVIAREHGAIDLAVQLAQNGVPVLITTRKNSKGHTELEEIARWREDSPDELVRDGRTPDGSDVGF